MKKVLMKTISPIIPQEFLLRNIHRAVLTAKHLNVLHFYHRFNDSVLYEIYVVQPCMFIASGMHGISLFLPLFLVYKIKLSIILTMLLIRSHGIPNILIQ